MGFSMWIGMPARMRTFHQILANTLVASITNFTVWFALTFWVYLETTSVFATGMIAGIYVASIAISGFWFGSIVAYSLAAVKLGELGSVIGWPLFMSSIVIVSMFTGLITGEWSRTGGRPIRIMAGGIACLVAAMAVLSVAAR